MTVLWAAEWYSDNALDGVSRHLVYENLLPVIFRTRKECREYVKRRYGYIALRPDLRREPHGWRVPRPVKVGVAKLAQNGRL